MSFAGHVLDMIKRQQSNWALKQRSRDRFSQGKNYNTPKSSGKEFNSEKFLVKSKSEIEQNRKKILTQFSRENKIAWLKTTIIIFALLILLLMWIN